MMKLSKKLIINLSLDWRKEKLDKFERAYLLREYIDSQNSSIRKVALELDIPRSTIEDWLLWNRITKPEYDELISQGVAHKDIYRSLRENKKQPVFKQSALDIQLKRLLKILDSPIKLNMETIKSIKEVQEILNKIVK